MLLAGETRPIANKSYTYTVLFKLINSKVISWKLEYNGKSLGDFTTGTFKFHPNLAGKTVKISALVSSNGKDTIVSTNVIVLAAVPSIIELSWIDINGANIGGRVIGYLDKVKLVVKTKNIPANEILKVTIYEDEYADGHDKDSSRNMGTYDAKVNNKGVAEINFNNIKVYQKTLNDKDYIDESEHEFYAQVIYFNSLDRIEDKIKLKIKNELTQLVKPKPINNPVVVGKPESVAKTKKQSVDFTFGVFLDGTLNNMYNTELRQAATGTKPTNNTGLILNDADTKEVYNEKGGAVKGDPSKGSSSYENDLSNPAILFKNYITNPTKNIFRIYTEGIGSNTRPNEATGRLDKNEYKGDDIPGKAVGMGKSGIKKKVRLAIDDMIKKMKNKGVNEEIGNITIDVFGFSRGAAAARHFVHVVTAGAYIPKKSIAGKVMGIIEDIQGYDLQPVYKDRYMPPFGYLGQKLEEAALYNDSIKVKVRFVGIYDTVPHHGVVQKNDYEDLGLDNVNRAQYVVHMVAADEHRSNFSLVDISSVTKVSADSGKKGGTELVFPGVHCDVGGAYVEGWSDSAKNIDSTHSYLSLKDLRNQFIQHGWFKDKEIFVIDAFGNKIDDSNHEKVLYGEFSLCSNRQRVSNQYSYIPLHIMAEFCNKKGDLINNTELLKSKNFTNNWIDNNIGFLQDLKKYLRSYAFNGGQPLLYKDNINGVPYPIQYDDSFFEKKPKVDNPILLALDDDKAKKVAIHKLRNHYLHWNSTYGYWNLDSAIQTNMPRKEDKIRKRKIY